MGEPHTHATHSFLPKDCPNTMSWHIANGIVHSPKFLAHHFVLMHTHDLPSLHDRSCWEQMLLAFTDLLLAHALPLAYPVSAYLLK